MYKYTDEWGTHEHKIEGPPYNPHAPITCAACLRMLDSRLDAWLVKLTERHNLPEGFWEAYRYSWR